MSHGQIYQLGALAFSVAEARNILAAAPRAIRYVSPQMWAANFHLTENDLRIDHHYAMTQTDLAAPVFVVVIATLDRPEQTVVIDGCHRLYRAYHERRRAVPAYAFTTQETQRIIAAAAAEHTQETITEHAAAVRHEEGCENPMSMRSEDGHDGHRLETQPATDGSGGAPC